MTRKHKRWTAEEDQFIRDNYGTRSVHNISKSLHRSVGSIWSRACFLGVSKVKYSPRVDIIYKAENPVQNPLDLQVGGSHYQLPIQPIEFIAKNGLNFAEGSVIKYVCRHRNKNGKEDLMKAKHYIDLLIAAEYGDCTQDT